MPSYTYIGDEERYYPETGVLAKPGGTATFDAKPDDLWVSSSSKKAAAVKADAPTDIPSDPSTDTTAQA